MSVGLKELKDNYNGLIERYCKAEKYLNSCNDEEFNKWAPEFNKIIVGLSELMKQYEEITGKKMSKEEVLNGF